MYVYLVMVARVVNSIWSTPEAADACREKLHDANDGNINPWVDKVKVND